MFDVRCVIFDLLALVPTLCVGTQGRAAPAAIAYEGKKGDAAHFLFRGRPLDRKVCFSCSRAAD